ncbi:MAG: hypothetical protein QNK15_06760 [Cycloclasticus sp.]|nr:hypothetical protein [Cycloclasticus sp.]
MTTTPDLINLDCVINASSFREAAQHYISTFSETLTSTIIMWALPSESKLVKGTAESFVLALSDDKAKAHTGTILKMDREILASIYKGTGDNRYVLNLVVDLEASGSMSMIEFLASARRICASLLQQNVLTYAKTYNDGGGLNCIPDVPLVEGSGHIVLVTKADVDESYLDSNAFWNSGWDSNEVFGDYHLLSRGLEIESSLEYLAEILPMQWTMARAARAGLTGYYIPQVLSEEERIYRQGERTLNIVGHESGDNTIELTCILEPGEQINGWEIFDLFGLLETGALPDGRLVEAIRIVFLNQQTAFQEQRVLLDIGVDVFYYDEVGELLQLTDV